MSHFDSPNEPGTGTGPARLALVAFAVLWVVLVVWALRSEERLFARSPEPPSSASRVVASGALPGGEAGTVAAAGVDPNEDGSGNEATGADPDADTATGAAADTGADTVDDVAAGTEPSADDDPVVDAVTDAAASAGTDAAADATTDTASDIDSDAVAAAGSVAGPRVGAGAETGADAEAVDEAVGGAGLDDPGADTGAIAGSGEPTTDPPDPDAPEEAAPIESPFEARRREELETLVTLLSDVSFEPLGDTLTEGARRPLERAFEILFLYPRTRVDLVVESRETNDPVQDRLLGGARAARLVDYLISRGIAPERLFAGTGDGRGLPFGEHRVRVNVEDEER